MCTLLACIFVPQLSEQKKVSKERKVEKTVWQLEQVKAEKEKKEF